MIRVALLDNNRTWLDQERAILLAYAQESKIELVIEAYASPTELFADNRRAPDALFVDIELQKDGSGVDLAHVVNEVWPECQIIYVTNYLRYATEVYATDHLWYLLKEDIDRRLPEVMDKLMALLEDRRSLLVVKTADRQLMSVRSADILSLERHGRTTTVSLVDGKSAVVPDKLTDLLPRMPQMMFVRCHGSYAVNLAHVRTIGPGQVVLDNGLTVPVSRRYVAHMRDAYLDWMDRHEA